MSGSPRSQDKPGPSHKDGKFRDPAIEEKQDPDFTRADLDRLLRKAVKPE